MPEPNHDDLILIRSEGPIRVVTLNRPDALNATNTPLHTAVSNVWRRLAEDEDASVVVLTGAGRAFSAGGDFAMMKQLNEDAAFREVVMEEVRRIIVDMLRFPLPVVAAVNGPAVGLGCSLALAADHVLLSDKAKLGDPHLNVGLVPGDGGVVLWPYYTSLLKVKEYLFTGKLIAAGDAVDMGLANRVVPHDELMNEAMAFAELLASKPRKALQDTKRALNSYIETQSRGPMEIAIQAEYKSMASPEHTKFVREQAAKATR